MRKARNCSMCDAIATLMYKRAGDLRSIRCRVTRKTRLPVQQTQPAAMRSWQRRGECVGLSRGEGPSGMPSSIKAVNTGEAEEFANR